tara:strand:- start:1413 stop:2078 length:666 start_codon:yes stop_codon:yes gene_type:complete
MNRISIREKTFNGIPTQEPLTKVSVVIIGVAFVSRIYYKDAYSSEKVAKPTCWSGNTETPALDVPEDQRQSGRCIDCTQNIKGSGRGTGRACRFVQRLALVLEDDLETVYQLQLPPTSIFGEAMEGGMPLRAYARYLEARETPFVALVTDMYFDDESNTPKLFFRPVRPLEEQELETVKKMMEHEDTVQALTLNVVPVEDRSASPFAVTDGFTIKNNLENV